MTTGRGTGAGEVLRDDDAVALRFVRELAVPVDDAWAAFTDSDRLAQWYASWTGEGRPGGLVFVTMLHEPEPADPEPVRIVECDAPRLLVVEWTDPQWPWRAEVTLEPTPSGTRLEFVQRGLTEQAVPDVGPGWQWYLDRLAATLTGAAPPAGWDDYLAATRSAYVVSG
jgi:uncharacterized protein YndB with AHSA1/START domain